MSKKIYERMEFDNYDEFLTQCEQPVSRAALEAWTARRDILLSDKPQSEWWDAGSDTYAEALTFAREGWKSGVDSLTDAVDVLAPYVLAAQRVNGEQMGVAGYRPDVQLFLAGDPAHMHQQGEEIPSRARVLRILVNLTANCHVNGASFVNRGAAIAAITDYLETTGTRVEIQACMAVEGYSAGRSYMEVVVPVKQADQQIEPDRLAFVLSSPAMLRRFMVRLMEQHAHLAASMGSGYGHAKDVQPASDQIYFPAGMHACNTPAAALKTVLGQVSTFMTADQKELLDADWQELLRGTDALGQA